MTENENVTGLKRENIGHLTFTLNNNARTAESFVPSLTATRVEYNGARTTGETLSCNSTGFIHVALSLGELFTYRTITKAQIKFKNYSCSSDEVGIYSSDENFSTSSADTPIDYLDEFTDGGTTYKILDVASLLCAEPTKKIYFAIKCAWGFTTIYTEKSLYFQPLLEIEYVTDNDCEENVTALHSETGDAGAYRINIRNGKLSFRKPLIQLDGNLLPLNLFIAYNAEQANTARACKKNTFLPNGWKFNYQQFLDVSETEITYVDGNYRKHIFKRCADNSSVYFDSHGKTGYILKVVPDGYELTDGVNITRIFDSYGKLVKITQKKAETAVSIEIVYDSDGKLTKITDGMGNITDFFYASDVGTVTVLQPDRKSIVIYCDTGNRLTEIKGEENGIQRPTSFYTYGNSLIGSPEVIRNDLISVKDCNGYLTEFGYNQSRRITFVKNYVEKENKKAVSAEFLEYKLLNTAVSYCRNTNLQSEAFLVKEFGFAKDGECISATETAGGSVVGALKVRVKDDYLNYMTTLSDQPDVEFTFDNDGASITLETKLADASDSAMSDSKYVDCGNQIGTEYVFSAVALINSANCHKSMTGREIKVRLVENGKDTLGEIYFDTDKRTLQICTKFITLKSGMHNLQAIGEIRKNAARVWIGDIRLYKVNNPPSVQCVNVATNSGSFYEPTVGNWFKMTDCRLSHDNTNVGLVKMTKRDYDLTKLGKQKAVANGAYCLWYNDATEMIYGVNNVKVKYLTTEFALENVDCAIVSRKGNKIIVDKFDYSNPNLKTNYISQSVDNTRKLIYVQNDNYGKLVGTADSKSKKWNYTYDKYGNLTRLTVRYGNNDPNNFATEYNYGDDGKYLKKFTEFNPDAAETTYTYDFATGNLIKTESDGLSAVYSYADNNLDLKKMSTYLGTVHPTNEIYNEFSYADGILTKIGHRFDYEFFCNDRNDFEKVKLANAEYISKEYDYGTAAYTETTLFKPTNYRERKTYDKYGRLVKREKKENSGSDFTLLEANIFYDKINGTPTDINDPFDIAYKTSADSKLKRTVGENISIEYNYDQKGRVVKTDSDTIVSNTYDNFDRITEQHITYSGNHKYITYAYENGDALTADRLKFVTASYGTASTVWSQESLVDFAGRKTEEIIKQNASWIKSTYTYPVKRSVMGTLPSAVTHLSSNGTSFQELITYDNHGNITSAVSAAKTNFYYDKLDRLVREDNQQLDKTYTFDYDTNGNILYKKEYAYTEGTPETALVTNNYLYCAPDFDRIDKWNGISFHKNSSGEHVFHKTHYLSWTRGSLLKTCAVADGTAKYYYNTAGIRTKKEIIDSNGRIVNTTTYYLNGDKIECESRSKDGTLYYIYGENGVIGFAYNNAMCYFGRDALGNISEVYQNGTVLAKYQYDAWGNCRVLDAYGNINTNSSFIGNINPFRYKGYYYDTETQFYYLQTRYYDPEICRFISPDSLEYLDPDNFNGLNLYAYCCNNPVNYVDPTGHCVITLTLISYVAIGLIALLGVSLLEAEYHPIEKTMKAIADMIADVDWVAVGADISNFFETIGAEVSEWWNVVWMGKSKGQGKDTEFAGWDNEKVAKEYEKAILEGNALMVKRLQREMKVRGLRNKRKKRGQPHMRGIGWLLLPEIIRRLLDGDSDEGAE